ncbi:MAG: thrombospondin type 3 repeat-containing protein [Pseudomonadales bacterium]
MSRAGLLTTAALLAAAALICLISPAAKAYELSGDAWPSPTTSYDVNLAGGPPGFTIQQLNQTFFDAMQEWNNVTSFTLNANLGVYKDPCSNPNNDPIGNGVQFSEQSCAEEWGSTTLAATIRWSSGGQIVQAGIVFNETRTWVINDDPPSFFNIDFKRVAVHELGHAMGLNHEDSVPAIMSTALSDIIAPTSDDIAGIEAIYNPSVDVGVLLSSGFESATYGETEAFSISVFVSGNGNAENVAVELGYNPPRAPTGLTIEGGSCSTQAFALRCILGTLQSADVFELTGTITPDQLGATELLASVTTSSQESDPDNNFSSDPFEVAAHPDDLDADSIANDVDNCPYVANPDQADADSDGVGDACITSDVDGDGVYDHLDNCPAVANRSQPDADGDGIGDACDTFSSADLSLSATTDTTFEGDEANQASTFNYTLTNNSEFGVSLLALRIYSGWPSEHNHSLFSETTDPASLSNGSLTTSETLQISHTLAEDTPFPIVAGFTYMNPELSVTASIQIAFLAGGIQVLDHDGDSVPNDVDDLPLNPDEQIDTDGDGLGNNADLDDDNDNLFDVDEPTYGTDPLRSDTDGDEMPDSFEVMNGFDPLVEDCPPNICGSEESSFIRLLMRLQEALNN